MTGSLAQSYFIFDSSKYKVGRKIYYSEWEKVELEENNEQDDINEIMGQNNNQTSS